MRVDVSEIKTFRSCKRKWQYTSRNKMHLTSYEPKSVFAMGTLFHEGLHALYMGVPIEQIMEDIKPRMQEDHVALLAMLPGYAKEILPVDMDRFKVMDIEYKFNFTPCDSDGVIFDDKIELCGSIDMIALDVYTNEVFGFEHKTCKNFREETFMWMDEQPRVYTIALQEYVNRINNQRLAEWENKGCIGEKPEPYKVGGIFINEVKKLLRKFSCKRTLCKYPKDDLDNFFRYFMSSATSCRLAVENNEYCAPSPDWMGCSMCDFNSVCSKYMYGNVDKDEILKQFEYEFKEREVDHLEEK